MEGNHAIILIDAENCYPFIINAQQPGNRKEIFNFIKDIGRNRGRGLERASLIMVKH